MPRGKSTKPGAQIDRVLSEYLDECHTSIQQLLADIQNAVPGKQVNLVGHLRDPSEKLLHEALSTHTVDAVIYIGHGGRDERGEFVVLGPTAQGGRAYWSEMLSSFQADLQFVVLFACVLEGEARVATSLIEQNSTNCVVTMPLKVSVDSAVTYFQHFLSEVPERRYHIGHRKGFDAIAEHSLVESLIPRLTLGDRLDRPKD